MGARAALAALVAAAVLAAGCGGGGDDEDDAGGQATEQPADTGGSGPRTGTEGEAAATSPACELLTTAEVSDLFGVDAQVVPGEAGNPAVASNCLWQAEVGDAESPTLYQLELAVYVGGTPLDPTLFGGQPQPLAGPGEGAFVVPSDGTGGTTAGFHTGDTSVVLRYAIPLSEDAPDPAVQSDDVVALLQKVAGRLG
jgi:hypothetical protein